MFRDRAFHRGHPVPPSDKPWNLGRPRAISKLIQEVATRRELMPSEILSDSQEPPFVMARREIMIELRKRGYSLTRIGKALGGLHHSTVLYNLQQPLTPAQAVVEPVVPQRVPQAATYTFDVPDESGIWAI